MTDFIAALTGSAIPFLRYALMSGLLASIAFGVIGSYVVARRISYIAGAIAHSVLGGVGLSLFVQYKTGVTWFPPMAGALLAALLSALTIGLVSLYVKEREDTVISAIWAIGMSTGLLFIAVTPGYMDPMSYLFGNILLITGQDVLIVAVLDCVIIGIGILFYNQFMAVCFDEEYATLRGIPTAFYFLLLLCLTAVTIVLLMRIVGIVMIIALLTLPPAIAGMFARRLWQMMVLAVGICSVVVVSGLAFSYIYDLPSGATIIILAGGFYLISVVISWYRHRYRG